MVGSARAPELRACLQQVRPFFNQMIPPKTLGALDPKVVRLMKCLHDTPHGVLKSSIQGALLANEMVQQNAPEDAEQ